MKIGIQGIRGSFHHKVAMVTFGEDKDILECMSFPSLVDQLMDGHITHAVMAIENSIAGAILSNYALIDNHNLHIQGECYLDIQHHLLGLEGQNIVDIKEVWSHPMAILQCQEFFREYPDIKLVEDSDTAAVAQRIQQEQLYGIAAIASQEAAHIYKLNTIASSIQTIQQNATRFFILNNIEKFSSGDANKASIRFTAEHKRGSLAAILNVLSDCSMNLTKIQSIPVIQTPWKYAFFVDVTFDSYEEFKKAEELLRIMALEFKVLGVYKNQRN